MPKRRIGSMLKPVQPNAELTKAYEDSISELDRVMAATPAPYGHLASDISTISASGILVGTVTTNQICPQPPPPSLRYEMKGVNWNNVFFAGLIGWVLSCLAVLIFVSLKHALFSHG